MSKDNTDRPRISITTKRDAIKNFPSRFNWQYKNWADHEILGHGKNEHPIGETRSAIIKLNLDTATEADIFAIMGSSWTSLECDECGRDVDPILHIGEDQDYESSCIDLCLDCADRVSKFVAKARKTSV